MSYSYKYNFISPEPTYALIREELKSYMDTGAVDDLLWPTYLNKCLDKLGKGSYVITDIILDIEDFEARLPDNFHSVREAWMCSSLDIVRQNANSFYSQAASSTTIQVSPVISSGTPCTNLECTAGCPECMPELIQAVYKTTNSTKTSIKREFLLKPGNISTRNQCSSDCFNLNSSAADSFDIVGNKFRTNFAQGTVYLVFYATDYDELQNQLIPDNYRIKEYVEAFIKYKVFETLFNQVNDETSKQIEAKMGYYKGLSDEAYILADIETKKQTPYQKIMSIKKSLNSFNKYELPNSRYRSTWRRN